jgi:nucleotidyltransferase substrate binding protein (TIGR01987 family)
MEKEQKKVVDVRWLQRFSNFRKALHKLEQAVEIVSEKLDWGDDVDDLLQEGLIQRFEYTHELAWKVMKDYAEYQGYTDIKGSRDAFRMGLQMGIIDSQQWMISIEDRNQTSHNYDDETVNEIYEAIVNEYYPLFKKFEKEMLNLSGLETKLF